MTDNTPFDERGRIITDRAIVFTQPNSDFDGNFAWETFKDDYTLSEQRQQLVIRNICHFNDMLIPPMTVFDYRCDNCGVLKPPQAVVLVGGLKAADVGRTHFTPRWPDDTLLVCDNSGCHSKDKFETLHFAYRLTKTGVQTILQSNTDPDAFELSALENPCTSSPEIIPLSPPTIQPVGNPPTTHHLGLVRPTLKDTAPLDEFRHSLEKGEIEVPLGPLFFDRGAVSFAERYVSILQSLIGKFPHKCVNCKTGISPSKFIAFQSSEKGNIICTFLCSEKCLQDNWNQEMTDMYRTNTCVASFGNQVSAVIFGCNLDDLIFNLHTLRTIVPTAVINSEQDVLDLLKKRAEAEVPDSTSGDNINKNPMF
jgi:hypothetical protein